MPRSIAWAALGLLALGAVQCGGSISGDGSSSDAGGSSGSQSGGMSSGASGGSGARAGTSGTAGSGGKGGAGNAGSSGRGGTSAGGTGGTGAGGTGGSSGSAGCTPNYACRPAAPATSGDPIEDCVARVNQFRACVCLPPLQRWTAGESCAAQDVAYDHGLNTAHAGFSSQPSICSPQGFAENECLGGSVASCIQSMFGEGPPPTNPCDKTCYKAHGHFINMTNPSYTRVACAIDGGWAVQNFE